MENLAKYAETIGISLSSRQLNQFKAFCSELIIWNEKFNLTGIKTPEEIEKKHFIDSLSILPYLPEGVCNLIDVGSGAGFPGLPLKIARPNLVVTLLDSIKKKTTFHTHIISELKLQNISTLPARAEEIAHSPDYREQFDVVTARAVTHLSTLIEYAIPLLKTGGICIAQKAIHTEEITAAQNALKILNAEIIQVVPIMIEGLSDRQLIIIKKKSTTSFMYPRKNGIPLKSPL